MNMSDILTKRKVLIFTIACALLFAATVAFFGISGSNCMSSEWCDSLANNAFTFLLLLAAPISALPFSVATYKMNDAVFRAWRNFAGWWIFLILGISYLLIEGGRSTGGLGISGAMEGSFILLIIFLLYAIFFLVSIFLIVRTWLKTRNR